MIKKLSLFCSVVAACHISAANAADFFIEDFESGGFPTSTTGSWKLQSTFLNDFGESDMFEVVNNIAHSGTYSLRFNYNGKNGYCNTCGLKSFTHKNGVDNVDYFVADGGEDLAATANAEPGKLLYNLTDGSTLWEIQSVENDYAINDKTTLKLLKQGIKGLGSNVFNSGDTIQVARECGVDGNFAGDLNRRQDCDRVIHYFTNVSGSQLPGDSIFRRIYIRFDFSQPPGTQKLRYWRVQDNATSGNVYLDFRATTQTKPNGYPLLILTGLVPKGDPDVIVTPPSSSNNAVFYPGFSFPQDISFSRGTWYYLEEEFKASNPPGSLTGEYRLWFSESGEEPLQNNPLIEVKNFNLPVAANTSLWGNIQHGSHTIGYAYIDDISISDQWHGAAIGDAATKDKSPPKPPNAQ